MTYHLPNPMLTPASCPCRSNRKNRPGATRNESGQSDFAISYLMYMKYPAKYL